MNSSLNMFQLQDDPKMKVQNNQEGYYLLR